MMKINRGFTLVELAVVLAVMGVLLSTSLGSLLAMTSAKQAQVTRERLEIVDEALRKYMFANLRMPCIASRSVMIGSAGFGRESCGGGGIANGDGNKIHIGTVPVRDLNLPDKYIYDGWHNRILYAVTENHTTVDDYMVFPSAIDVIDRTGTSVTIDPVYSANTFPISYLLLSHGADGKGAFGYKSGQQAQSCGLGSNLDVENCDNTDVTFRDIQRNIGDVEATFFLMIWCCGRSGQTLGQYSRPLLLIMTRVMLGI